MIRITSIFRPATADSVRRSQLFEADRLAVEHQAAAELHAGLAGIYRLRTERLRKELAGDAPAALRSIK